MLHFKCHANFVRLDEFLLTKCSLFCFIWECHTRCCFSSGWNWIFSLWYLCCVFLPATDVYIFLVCKIELLLLFFSCSIYSTDLFFLPSSGTDQTKSHCLWVTYTLRGNRRTWFDWFCFTVCVWMGCELLFLFSILYFTAVLCVILNKNTKLPWIIWNFWIFSLHMRDVTFKFNFE